MTSLEKGRRAGKQAEPTLKVLQSEALHSLNYLYQSAVLSAIRSSIQKTTHGDSIEKIVQLQSLARKSTLRLDASISRSVCRRCHVPLISGLTSTICSKVVASTSRVMQIRCRLCTLNRRQVAPPNRKENGHSLALRNCRKAARKLQYKLAKYHQPDPISNSPDCKLAPSIKVKDEPASVKKWSQRARRRAGRIKAQMLDDNDASKETTDAIPLQIQQDTNSNSKMIRLPRYASRIKGYTDWDSTLKSEMSNHEREAIKILRGDHLVSSGIGRGGYVGQIDVASPSNVRLAQ